VATAAAVAADLRRVGMGAEVRPVPFPALVARLTARDGAAPWQAVLLGFGGNVPPDAALWGSVYRSSGSLHVWSPRQARPATAWEARIDALAASLSGAADFLVRKKAHDEILDILADQQPLIHLYTPDLFVAARAAVANFRPSPLRPHATWNAEELFLDPGAAATAAR